MDHQKLIHDWFEKWHSGKFHDLPVTESFTHTSPFGTITGKQDYMKLVENNRDKFLGYRFSIVDEIYGTSNACVRYIAEQNDFKLEVSEWYYFEGALIKEIVAYYHIGEIREERTLN